ncbi:MAG: hypothetical protein KW788_00670 [Candidatus Doudnabacteria bacterium]|nr:hypothetical protein [Candidatus Doudnabacteria bacterium]
MQTKLNPKDNAAHLFCLFLAEEMRMRMISLGTAKEMARAVVAHKNLIDSEEHMLRLIMELAKDFPQLKKFEQKLAVYIERQGRSDAEKKVTEFVAGIMDTDQNLAMQVLEDAIDANNNLDILKNKYPKFAEFLNQPQ